ncbi:MAG: hypothetical protein DCC68_17700 [Planctomycetota bacterium]|nr:MAG: hypothetical protein DCC68_17700 [Planctomycetota bacterium]
MKREPTATASRPRPLRKGDLTEAQRQLVEQFQRIDFGGIRNLHVVDGQPVFAADTRIVRHRVLGGRPTARPERITRDFVLKAAVVDFLEYLARMKQGKIMHLDIRHGLPLQFETEEAVG